MRNKMWRLAVTAGLGLMMTGTVAQAADNDVLSTGWTSTGEVGQDQAQIVYFRDGGAGTMNGNANIYVDGEFQTALIPGSYTAFCVKPGVHSLGAWLADDPTYRGKQEPQSVSLEGGKTYYFRAEERRDNRAMPIAKSDALSLITGTRLQNILLSRASAVVACQYQSRDYVLPSDILFNFARSSRNNINQEGRNEISRIARDLQSQGVSRVVVTGHTDPIGSPESNLKLGLKRAETVRSMLAEEGLDNISVMTAGSREPVATGCEGLPRAQKISCLAPDRRVVIRGYTE